MKKEQVDIANQVVFIEDSKTPTGVSEVPLTDIATEAFSDQLNLAGPGQWLFPVLKIPLNIRRLSRPSGMRHCVGQGFDTFASTISAPRTRPGSVPGALPTSG